MPVGNLWLLSARQRVLTFDRGFWTQQYTHLSQSHYDPWDAAGKSMESWVFERIPEILPTEATRILGGYMSFRPRRR